MAPRASCADIRHLQELANVGIALSRDISTSESAALAKESEEAELYRVMESDVAVQAMRRLATIRL